MDSSEGTGLMVASLAWKDQGLVLHFWPGFFLATHGERPWGPGSSSRYYPKVQFHVTTSVTVALVKSTRVQPFILSLPPKTCPMVGHCLLGGTGTSRQGSELLQQRRWAQASSAADRLCTDPYLEDTLSGLTLFLETVRLSHVLFSAACYQED